MRAFGGPRGPTNSESRTHLPGWSSRIDRYVGHLGRTGVFDVRRNCWAVASRPLVSAQPAGCGWGTGVLGASVQVPALARRSACGTAQATCRSPGSAPAACAECGTWPYRSPGRSTSVRSGKGTLARVRLAPSVACRHSGVVVVGWFLRAVMAMSLFTEVRPGPVRGRPTRAGRRGRRTGRPSAAARRRARSHRGR